MFFFFCFFQAALPDVQEQYQGVLKEIKALQQQEHALQEESLGVRLRIEQIEATITEQNNKIKHWQKEVGEERCCCELMYYYSFILVTITLMKIYSANLKQGTKIVQ